MLRCLRPGVLFTTSNFTASKVDERASTPDAKVLASWRPCFICPRTDGRSLNSILPQLHEICFTTAERILQMFCSEFLIHFINE